MSSRRWVHGTTTYDRNNPRVFIALGGDGMFHLFVQRRAHREHRQPGRREAGGSMSRLAWERHGDQLVLADADTEFVGTVTRALDSQAWAWVVTTFGQPLDSGTIRTRLDAKHKVEGALYAVTGRVL